MTLIAGRGITVGPARIAVSERYRPGGRSRRARLIRPSATASVWEPCHYHEMPRGSGRRELSRRPEPLSGLQWVLATVLGVGLATAIGLSTYHWSATPAAGDPWYSALIGVVVVLGRVLGHTFR